MKGNKDSQEVTLPQFRFTTSYDSTFDYSHFSITFWALTGSGRYERAGVKVSWQATTNEKNPRDDNKRWYAFHFAFDNIESGDKFKRATRVFNLITRPWGPDWHGYYAPQPHELLLQLERSRTFEEGIYDPRLGELIALADYPDPDLNRWVDDTSSYDSGNGWSGCLVDCLARTREEAQPLIMAELATEGYDEALVNFIQAGKPVRMTDSKLDGAPLTGLQKLDKIAQEVLN